MLNTLLYLLQAYVIIGLLLLGLTLYLSKDEFLKVWDKLQESEGRADGNIIMISTLVIFVFTWPLAFKRWDI